MRTKVVEVLPILGTVAGATPVMSAPSAASNTACYGKRCELDDITEAGTGTWCADIVANNGPSHGTIHVNRHLTPVCAYDERLDEWATTPEVYRSAVRFLLTTWQLVPIST
ncbi:hypothetical protein ACQPXH_26725 [Nocardia sp. CA-135953]|uniref:hypothetical protein n=1 Tax=Nocardia sp. CA-135953 TaxID=3239978 RepID=UPI003D982E63